MNAPHPLLARLWPFLSVAAATACAKQPTPTNDVPPAPLTPPGAASTRGTDTSPPPSASTAAAAPGSSVPAASASPTSSASLGRCRACSLHCYPHAQGEHCLPSDAGVALDLRVGCAVHDKAGPRDDGKQCCYGAPCRGRPLRREGLDVLASLIRSVRPAGWA